MTGKFLDLFSAQSSTYASARPSYPPELYEYLMSVTPGRDLVWDCATGNGQAARDLARHFTRVIATDASAEQIGNAVRVSNVEYAVASAEACGLPNGVFQLVTVAQALHWLDHDRFAAEVRRVTVKGGILAAWFYGSCYAGEDVDPILREFQDGTMGPYWNPNRKWIDEGYRTIPFPFQELRTPTFELRVRWSLSQLGEYISSWSSVAAYRRATGKEPLAPLLERLGRHWTPSDAPRDVTWPLGLRVGRT